MKIDIINRDKKLIAQLKSWENEPIPSKPHIIEIQTLEFTKEMSTSNQYNFPSLNLTKNINNTVTWINNGDTTHFIEFYNLQWGTELIMPGESVTMTFDETGIYRYHDKPWITGKITVLE
jgi:plastocyanin